MADDDKKTCVRCGYEADKKDKYCIKCGAPLDNGCTNKGDIFNKGCKKVNSADAAFCSGCGAPTLFNKEGLIYVPTNPISGLPKDR